MNFAIPTATYSLLKTLGNSELLANPELRISEGEKATLHIGQRIPVPVTTISGYNPGTDAPAANHDLAVPYTSFQYQDVGIKVAMEPRVHHNREVTLKLTVEVSNQGAPVEFAGQDAADVRHAHDRVDDPPQGRRDELPGRPHSVEQDPAAPPRLRSSATSRFIGRLFTNEHTRARRAPISC